MDIHQNARLTPHGRAELVRRVLLLGQAPRLVAAALGVTVKTVNTWCERCRGEALGNPAGPAAGGTNDCPRLRGAAPTMRIERWNADGRRLRHRCPEALAQHPSGRDRRLVILPG